MPITSRDAPISTYVLTYERQRLRNAIHHIVIEHFMAEAAKSGLTKAELARRLNKRPEQITRCLSAPGNWTLDTVCDLMLAMGLDPVTSALAKQANT